MTTTCEAVIGLDGRCTGCGEIVFPHIWERVLRKRMKPAKRHGTPPAGVRRKVRR